MIVLAIDPGGVRKGSALALTRDGIVVYAKAKQPHGIVPDIPWEPRNIVIERPQIDKRSRYTAPALLEVAWCGALLAGRLAGVYSCEILEYSPTEWKGSVPKPVHHARIWGIMLPQERALVGGEKTYVAILASRERGALSRWAKPGASYCRGYDDDLMDAVGLALFHHERF